jgi:hypothetical protein
MKSTRIYIMLRDFISEYILGFYVYLKNNRVQENFTVSSNGETLILGSIILNETRFEISPSFTTVSIKY